MVDHDIRPRVIDAPREGFWLIRCCPRCPWVPARIVILETRYEPGHPDNDMTGTRSPAHGAFISGQPVSIQEVWGRRGRVITRSEYERALAEIAEAVRVNRYHPACQPFKPVAIEQLDIPFSEEADAARRQPSRTRRRAQ